MITNERQYRITRSQAEKFREALKHSNELELIRSGIDPVIAAAHKQGLKAQLLELDRALSDYDELRSGERAELVADHIWEIGERLVQARVARGFTQRELAERLNLKEQQVQRYEHERYRTANLERLSAIADALSIEVNIVLQMATSEGGQALHESRSFDPAKLPIREMKRRGWLDEFARESGQLSDSDAERARKFIAEYHGAEGHALHRKNVRSGSTLDEYALLAWKSRVLQKARRSYSTQFTYEPLDAAFVREIVELSQERTGVVESIHALRSRGVIVVFEPHLKGTHLDGAAMLLDGSVPVIGLTLRHDRLDNFWFTLLHEIGHVVCHRHQGLRDGFFDDNSAFSEDALEAEADEFAENALIPSEAWKASFVRFTKSAQEVQQFAKRFKVGDAVVAGRIRRERGYHLFREFIGSGCVRELISDAGLME